MGQGLEQVLWVAERIEGLPSAMLNIKKPLANFIPVYAICFIFVCVGRLGLKAVGIASALALACVWAFNPTPVARISADGHVTWQSDDKDYHSLNQRADRFGRDQFLRGQGEVNAQVLKAQNLDQCDSRGCVLTLKGLKIALIETPDMAAEACETSAIVIIRKHRAGPRTRFLCEAEIIDPATLVQSGSIDLYVNKSGPVMKTVKHPQRQRPWD